MWSAGRSNHDIGAVASLVKLFKQDRLPIELGGQLLGTVVGAIGHKNRFCAVGDQVPRSQLAHLARADQVDMLTLERSKNLLGQFDSDRSNGHRGRPHRRFPADSFGYSES